MGAADWGIGHEVSGVTSTGEKFAGEVFTFDEGTGIAVLRTKGDIINTHDVRVLNTEGCKEVKSSAPKVAPAVDKLPVVDEARNKRREEAALKAAQASAGASTVSSRPRESTVRPAVPPQTNPISAPRPRPRTHSRSAPSHRVPLHRSQHRRGRDAGGAGHLRRPRPHAPLRVGREGDSGDGRSSHPATVCRVRSRHRSRGSARGGAGAEGPGARKVQTGTRVREGDVRAEGKMRERRSTPRVVASKARETKENQRRAGLAAGDPFATRHARASSASSRVMERLVRLGVWLF